MQRPQPVPQLITDRTEDEQHDLQRPDGGAALVVVGELVHLLEQQVAEPRQVLVRRFLLAQPSMDTSGPRHA